MSATAQIAAQQCRYRDLDRRTGTGFCTITAPTATSRSPTPAPFARLATDAIRPGAGHIDIANSGLIASDAARAIQSQHHQLEHITSSI